MKKALIYLSCMLACCLLFLHSATAVSAGIRGFYIWRDTLLPTLLPFFVCTYVMQNTGVPSVLERATLILLSLFSGAPSGARLLSRSESVDTRSVAILNNISPVFVCISFCSGALGSPAFALPVLTAQFSSVFILLLLFRPGIYTASVPAQHSSSLKTLGMGITSGMSSMLGICGALIFFMSLTAVVNEVVPFPTGLAGALLSGILEAVSGCTLLASLSLPARTLAASAAFVFSFGGICIFAQSLTFCHLDPVLYFSTKLLQGGLSALIAWLVFPLFPSAHTVYSSVSVPVLISNTLSFLKVLGVSVTAMSAVMLMGAAARHRKFFSGAHKRRP